MPFSHIKSTERIVSDILALDKDARSSDTNLLITAMWMYGIHLTPGQIRRFKSMPSFEAITRCRRRLQQDGKFLPAEQITKDRHEKAQRFKQEIMHWQQ